MSANVSGLKSSSGYTLRNQNNYGIADAFDVSTDYLLGRSDEPRPKPADAILVDAIINCRDSIQQVLDEVDRIKSA